ncbi:hypothetical protein GCM10010923_02940 [Blastomonas marina]|uniref:Uncharacterized protein n=1 Tax=Blastomonas marina TaxID=1867408 RepID=A0ABQ1F3E2_9SPHN|nr:hypothetical protein [Blastomonas marina]GFZ98224.1 hypothetical protein GCM10010923_02940 [Blastomonas marina]
MIEAQVQVVAGHNFNLEIELTDGTRWEGNPEEGMELTERREIE